jgi:hypothetical protein
MPMGARRIDFTPTPKVVKWSKMSLVFASMKPTKRSNIE